MRYERLDRETVEALKAYEYCVFTFIDEGGYPFSLPVFRWRADLDENAIRLARPKGLELRLDRPVEAGLLFNLIDDKLDRREYVLLMGKAAARQDEIVFKPERRSDTNLPIQSAQLRARRAQEYLERYRPAADHGAPTGGEAP